MAHYVIGDIHGCYDEFLQMLDVIRYDDDEDILFFVGDYIDRGEKSYEMVQWLIANKSGKVIPIKGNHEEEFIIYINILNKFNFQKEDNQSLLTAIELLHNEDIYFDTYGTLYQLVKEKNMGISELKAWKDFFETLPYMYLVHVNKKDFCIVHAGYTKELNNSEYTRLEDFYLYSRGEEAYKVGGHLRAITVAGHTPTIVKSELTYNEGNIFYLFNQDTGKAYYDVDCGCVFRKNDPKGKLGCLCLENEQCFYV